MSPAYRAHPLAQAIEEAARIFGPEVTAAALLAAVEAASVRSTTPSRSFRRKLWTTLEVEFSLWTTPRDDRSAVVSRAVARRHSPSGPAAAPR